MAETQPLADLLGPALASALERKGYTQLTPVQKAVLDPKLADRDLRISSQTGSGKTVAIGLILRHTMAQEIQPTSGAARPRALVVTPTRELAKQVEDELRWLFAPMRARVASVTGGSNYREEHRALAGNPALVVGTPGRLLDHLNRGSIKGTEIGAIVLDEADRMLDLGFREDLEAILAFATAPHRTHLVSATFADEVRSLADRVQQQSVRVEGTRLGQANTDIDHVVHLVDSQQRLDAIVNLLLANPDEQTLVFARTRADVAELAEQLQKIGFRASSLSGEMEQAARHRALGAFKRNELRVLVATDVAARGIDVQDVARVIHADPPTDPDSYTHRSGRTGRAGRKGVSSLLVVPNAQSRTVSLLRRAGVQFRFEALPSAASIRAAAEQRLFDELISTPTGEQAEDPRFTTLAERLAREANVTQILVRLLKRDRSTHSIEPRELRAHNPAVKTKPPRLSNTSPVASRSNKFSDRPGNQSSNWVPFRVTYGAEHNADPRKLLAVVCRRGRIRGSDVGAIRIGPSFSVVEVAGTVAKSFGDFARRPDPRDPRVTIALDQVATAQAAPAPKTPVAFLKKRDKSPIPRTKKRHDSRSAELTRQP